MASLCLVGVPDLARLSGEADASPRRRKNRNLHEMEDPVHRLLNAIEPGSYVRPHRHLDPPKSETVVVVSGALGVLTFDDAGRVVALAELRPGGDAVLADIPPEVWHTLLALQPGTVFFETKVGPYVTPAPPDLAAWAPAEGDTSAPNLLQTWAKLFISASRETPILRETKGTSPSISTSTGERL